MSESIRDLAGYSLQYEELPFEPIQIGYRRKKVIEEIAAVSPSTLLEVGCGNLPLFLDFKEGSGVKHFVVEPTHKFALKAFEASKFEVMLVFS